jgi:hypothetical protein
MTGVRLLPFAKLFLLVVSIAIIVTVFPWLLIKAVRWVWHNYHKKKLLSILVLCVISALFAMTGLDEPGLRARSFVWFLVMSFATILFIGSDFDRAEQRIVDGEIAEAKDNIEKLDGILLELGLQNSRGTNLDFGVNDPMAKPTNLFLPAELRRRLVEHIEDRRSDVSVRRLYRFFDVYAPIMLLIYIMLALAAYTNWVFPFIPLKLGGGQAAPITLYEPDSSQSHRVIHGTLLDQSDEGFFILPRGQERGLFIPKDKVEAIYFSDGPPDLDKILK